MAWRDPKSGDYIAPIAGIRANSREEAITEALNRLGGPPEPFGVAHIEAGQDAGSGGVVHLKDVAGPQSEAAGEFFVRVTLKMPPDHVPAADQVKAALSSLPARVPLHIKEVEAYGDLLWGNVGLLELCTTDFVRLETSGHFAVLAPLRGKVRYFLGSREAAPGHPAAWDEEADLTSALAKIVPWLEQWDADICGKAMWPDSATQDELRQKFAGLCRMEAFEAAGRVVEHAVSVAEAQFGLGHSRIAGILKDFAREYDLVHQRGPAEVLRERARQIIHTRLHT